MLLVVGVFYFLTWDWLHGRLLTLKNPYKRYRRFFIEILIAFFGYGAALQAIELEFVLLLVHVGIVLLLGSLWARFTLSKHDDGDNKAELETITSYQPVMFLLGVLGFTIVSLIFRDTSDFAITLLTLCSRRMAIRVLL